MTLIIYKVNKKVTLIYTDTVMFVGVTLEPHKGDKLLKSVDHTDLPLFI